MMQVISKIIFRTSTNIRDKRLKQIESKIRRYINLNLTIINYHRHSTLKERSQL